MRRHERQGRRGMEWQRHKRESHVLVAGKNGTFMLSLNEVCFKTG